MAPKSRQLRQATQLINKPTSQLIVDQRQSLELVKTVITATLSTIAWCREIFPDDRFVIRVYDCADPSTSYDSFMKGISGFSFDRSDNVLNWRVLTRGVDPAADKMLELLELGVTDALIRKYLSKVQLSFHTLEGSEIDDSNLIEAHILTITYEDGIPTVGTEIKTGKAYGANSIVLYSAKQQLQGVIKNIALLTQDLDPLPVQRRMYMKMLYNKSCPTGYEPEGFRTHLEPDSSILVGDRGARVGSMRTGFHGVSVKVIQQIVEGTTSSLIGSMPEIYAADNSGTNTGLTGKTVHEAPDALRPTTTTTSSKVVQRRHSSSSLVQENSTQEEAVRLFKSMVCPILERPTHRTAADRDRDKGASRVPNSDTQDTLPLNLGSQPSTLAAHCTSTAASLEAMPKPRPYSQAVLKRISAHKQASVEHEVKVMGSQLEFRCECKALNDVLDLSGPESVITTAALQCSLCGTMQHARCYGHLVPPESGEHVCYTCLLETEQPLLREMEEFCIKRRALHFLREHGGIKTIKRLAIFLDREDNKTLKIIDELKREGYIKARFGAGKANTKAKNERSNFQLICSDEMLVGKYFDPGLKIQHHLTVPDDSFAITSTGGGRETVPSQQPSKSINNSSLVGILHPGQNAWRILLQSAPFQAGSSTEGTPSPEPEPRTSSTLRQESPKINGLVHPDMQSPLLSYGTNETASDALANSREYLDESRRQGRHGNNEVDTSMQARQKRALDLTDESKTQKRIKASCVRSPWVLRKHAK